MILGYYVEYDLTTTSAYKITPQLQASALRPSYRIPYVKKIVNKTENQPIIKLTKDSHSVKILMLYEKNARTIDICKRKEIKF